MSPTVTMIDSRRGISRRRCKMRSLVYAPHFLALVLATSSSSTTTTHRSWNCHAFTHSTTSRPRSAQRRALPLGPASLSYRASPFWTTRPPVSSVVAPSSASRQGGLTRVWAVDDKRSGAVGAVASNDCAADGWQHRLEQALDRLDLAEASNLFKQASSNGNGTGALKLSRDLWNKIFQAIEERTAKADMEMFQNTNARNSQQQNLLAEFPAQSMARMEMTQLYESLKDAGQLQLFGAVNLKDAPPVAGTHTVPPPVLEQVTGLSMSSLTPQPTNTLLLVGVALAVVEVLVSAVTSIPLNLLAFLTLTLVLLDRIAVNGAVLESALKVLQPGTQKKIVQHEAGHFLAAYLLGCPVEGIVLSAWAALRDGRFGGRQVSAGTSFYDPQLSSQMNSGGGKITRSSIDRYSAIVMAGIAAEADQNGRADGGAGDELALIAFLSQLNANSPRSSPLWTGDGIRNQARWGAMQSVMLLKQYRPAYDALVDAMERGGSLGECVYAIEKAARDHNLAPLPRPLGVLVEDGTSGLVSFRNSTAMAMEPVAAEVLDTKANGSSGATPPLTVPPSVVVMDEKQSLQKLGEIRAQVEERLRAIDEKLKEIEA